MRLIHRWTAVCVLFALAGLGAADPVAGQPPAGGFPIYGLICDRDPGIVHPAEGPFPPEGCEGQAGIKMVVETGDARPIGSCMTDGEGFCTVDAPFDSVVIVRQMTDTVRGNYAPTRNPIMTWNYTEFAGAQFFNIPVQRVESTPIPRAATLRIHSRVCPPGFAGTDFGAACHDTAPGYEQTLFLNGPAYRTATVDESGNAAFNDVPPGDYTLQPGLPESTARLVTF
ncbi:MAG TPA: hypothetical protein VGR16_07840, partial [Thermomicrobiales bacterium]|nr:hypothetical protein [Thermomicrobiales bacterium]